MNIKNNVGKIEQTRLRIKFAPFREKRKLISSLQIKETSKIEITVLRLIF